MKMSPSFFRRSLPLLAAALCGGGLCHQARAQSGSAPAGAYLTTPTPIVSTGTASVPSLVAQIVPPNIKTIHDGGTIKLKTGVTVTNQGGVKAKNVTVTVYLSDDGTLSADDTLLVTLDLSDYKSHGSLAAAKSFTIPLPYKIPVALAAGLQGKYLIFVAKADGFTATATSGEAVLGPIKLP